MTEWPAAPDGALGPLHRRLFALVPIDASAHIDDLIRQLEENSSSEVIAALCELELAGLVRQLPGKNYVRVW